MNDNEINFELKGWPGVIVVICIISFAFFVHDRIYYHNPRVKPLIKSLQSNDPTIIGEALCETDSFTMERGHKLIPYILPLLRDERELPENLKNKIIKDIQSTPGSIPGMEGYLKKIQTIGFTAALTLQGLVINDILHKRWVGGKYKNKIVSYVIEDIGLYDNEFSLKNGLWAVTQIHAKRLIPFWFQCLTMESESIKLASLSGLYYYIHDRSHGMFTWHPEKEIDNDMLEKLKACETDNSPVVRTSSSSVIKALKNAGLNITLNE